MRFHSTVRSRLPSSSVSARRNWWPPPDGGGRYSWNSATSARARRVRANSTSVRTGRATRRARLPAWTRAARGFVRNAKSGHFLQERCRVDGHWLPSRVPRTLPVDGRRATGSQQPLDRSSRTAVVVTAFVEVDSGTGGVVERRPSEEADVQATQRVVVPAAVVQVPQ